MNADELNAAVTDAWREFYSLRKVARRLTPIRPPVTKGNMILWALNLGISRIVSRYSSAKPVRSLNQPASVFEQMEQTPHDVAA